MQLTHHALLLASVALHALAQTPPNTSPSTRENLAVSYGDRSVTPGIKLPRQETTTIPTFSFNSSSPNQTYSLLLVDLSIRRAQIDRSTLDRVQLPFAPGVSPERTTRLHFWQPGVTFSSNGTLVNATQPIAYYNGPMPPPGDTEHTYVFYLFEQSDAFRPPPSGNPFNVDEVNSKPSNRYSFNVGRLSREDGIGRLVAGNYIRVQNPARGMGPIGGNGTMSVPGTTGAVGSTGMVMPTSNGTGVAGSTSGVGVSGSAIATATATGAESATGAASSAASATGAAVNLLPGSGAESLVACALASLFGLLMM